MLRDLLAVIYKMWRKRQWGIIGGVVGTAVTGVVWFLFLNKPKYETTVEVMIVRGAQPFPSLEGLLSSVPGISFSSQAEQVAALFRSKAMIGCALDTTYDGKPLWVKVSQTIELLQDSQYAYTTEQKDSLREIAITSVKKWVSTVVQDKEGIVYVKVEAPERELSTLISKQLLNCVEEYLLVLLKSHQQLFLSELKNTVDTLFNQLNLKTKELANAMEKMRFATRYEEVLEKERQSREITLLYSIYSQLFGAEYFRKIQLEALQRPPTMHVLYISEIPAKKQFPLWIGIAISILGGAVCAVAIMYLLVLKDELIAQMREVAASEKIK